MPTSVLAASKPCARRRRAGRHLLRALAVSLLVALVACHGSVESQLKQARALQEAGDQKSAVKELRKILAAHPDNTEASLRLGAALLALGRPSEALFPLKNAAKSDNANGRQAELLVAATLLQTGNLEAAIAATENVLQKDPDNKAALVTRARAALSLHRGKTALDSADRLLKASPGEVQVRLLRAQALAEIPGREDEAERLYQELEKADWGKDKSGPGRTCNALGKLYKDEEKLEKAAAQLQDCGERYSDDPATVMGAVGLLDEIQKHDVGTQVLKDAVAKHPAQTQLRQDLAQRYFTDDQFKEAEALVLKAAEEQKTARSWRAVAEVRRLSGDREGALEAVKKGLAISPDDDALRFFRADLLVELGRLDEAEAEAKKLKSDLYLKIIHGRLALERGDAKGALVLFSDAEREWPDNPGLRVEAARAALKLGDEDRAISELREAIRASPKQTDASLMLARLYFARGNYEYAVSMARGQIVNRGTTTPEAHLIEARSQMAEGKPKAAYETLLNLSNRRDGLFAGSALAEMGRVEERMFGAKEARERLEKRIQERKLDLGDPKNDMALRELCHLDQATGHLDDAIARVDKLVAAHPKSAELLALRGQLRLDKGDMAGASADFAKALSMNPDQPIALAGQGVVLRDSGDLDGAIQHFDHAAKLDPRVPDFAYLAAQAELAKGDEKGAEKRLEELLQTHPDYAPACNDLAWLLAQNPATLDRALVLSQRAVRLGGGPEMLDTLGYIELKKGNIEQAVAVLKRAVKAKPDYATANYHLALALVQQGDKKEAQEALRAALAGGSFPEADQARLELVRLQGKPGAQQ